MGDPSSMQRADHRPNRFQRAVIEAVEREEVNRAKSSEPEIEFVLHREKDTSVLIDLLAQGELPERITHNDTKFNNVMIDKKTDEAVCVIDLDTVMPGLPLYDFGDLIRTATSTAEEDETDLSKVEMRMSMFEPLLEGYFETAKNFLSPLEIELMPFSGRLISLEIAIRFLTDYLEGDVYFKIQHEGHNLERCRNQLAMVRSIESQEEAMKEFVVKVTS